MSGAPVVNKSLREQILDKAYLDNRFKDVLFQTPTTCKNCNCEFVQILEENQFRRTFACMYCGVIFRRESTLVA